MTAPRPTHAVLVIADISGYTAFIKHRNVSLVHAEAIITDLLDAVIDRAEHPLRLNKLEGDAALFWLETGDDRAAAVADAMAQVAAMFPAFAQRLAKVAEDRSACGCDACAKVNSLALKAFVHRGDIVVKQVRQFEELAGEPVIAVHRLLKNPIPARDYVLWSAEVATALRPPLPGTPLDVETEGLGTAQVFWLPHSNAAIAALVRPPTGHRVSAGDVPRTQDIVHFERSKPSRLGLLWEHLGLMGQMLSAMGRRMLGRMFRGSAR